MLENIIRHAEDMETVESESGSMTWMANADFANTNELSVGRLVVKPGCSTTYHHHDNAEEILYLLEGELEHSAGPDTTYRMKPGDIITMPPHLPHDAKSVGDTDAVAIVIFSTANRNTIAD